MKNFSFIKNQKFFFGIVIAALVVGIVSFIVRGFNLDIDFVGGTEISYNMGQPITKEDEAVIENDVKAIIGTGKLLFLACFRRKRHCYHTHTCYGQF